MLSIIPDELENTSQQRSREKESLSQKEGKSNPSHRRPPLAPLHNLPDKPVATDKPATDRVTTDKPVTDRATTDKPLLDKSAADKPTDDKPTTDKPILDKRHHNSPSPSSPMATMSSWYVLESPQQSITSQGRAEGERQAELERALRETLGENRRLHELADRLLRENEELKDRVKQLDLVTMLYDAAKSEIDALLAPPTSSRDDRAVEGVVARDFDDKAVQVDRLALNK